MTELYLWDDARARALEPFALTRPIGELRSGAWLLRERWERGIGRKVAGAVTAPWLVDFVEEGAPSIHTTTIAAGAVVGSSRCVLAGNATLVVDDASVGRWRCGDRIAAVRLTRAVEPTELAAAFAEAAEGDTPVQALAGWWVDDVWDLVGGLSAQLMSDLPLLAAELEGARPGDGAHLAVLGDHLVLVEAGASLGAFVVLDATAGPIVIRRGATIGAHSIISGPTFIGIDATVVGGSIRGCAIGEAAKVRGELSASTVLGFSNKGHDGFVGHSYLGRWVNLGAGTTTSNLKNTYGNVALWTPEGIRDSGLQFLGTLFGDHAKTGIGLRLTTGCVVGAGANAVDTMPPKVLAPFAWGAQPPYALFEVDKFVQVARRVMARRGVVSDATTERYLGAIHAARWEPRS